MRLFFMAISEPFPYPAHYISTYKSTGYNMDTLGHFLFKGGIAIGATMLISLTIILLVNARLMATPAMLILIAGLSLISLSAMAVGRYISRLITDTNQRSV